MRVISVKSDNVIITFSITLYTLQTSEKYLQYVQSDPVVTPYAIFIAMLLLWPRYTEFTFSLDQF